MAQSFKELKRTRAQQFERLLHVTRYNLGKHKHTQLRDAGCGGSGSLLHSEVAKLHAGMLLDNYKRRLAKISKIAAHERLRFLTILHSVMPLRKRQVIRAAENMEASLRRVFKGSKVWLLGAIEVEIVSISLLRRIGSLTSDEARKLSVLEGISAAGDDFDSGVLVHFHGVVDLVRDTLQREVSLGERFKAITAWQRAPYQIEMKRLFKTRTTLANLRDIASYVTKGGNDQLRYNAGFGRELEADLDAKIWRAGMGRTDRGAETVFDERGLSVGEIQFLDAIWRQLMGRRRDKRGYLVRIG